MKRILVCEDNRECIEMVRAILRHGVDFEVDDCGTGEGCIARFSRGYDLVILDLGLPDLSGLDVLKRLRGMDPNARVIVMTASDSVDAAVVALRSGAAHYIRKPLRIADLRGAVNETLGSAPVPPAVGEAPLAAASPLPQSKSPTMQRVYELVRRVADKSVSVLIHGPTGSGKEHIAQLLHDLSGRSGQLVAVSCPGIPVNLAESILFGHEKGAFTGATARAVGKLMQAQGGTIFFDEVADLPTEVQVKLLRVLQERKVEPLGSTESLSIDVRVVVASSRDLRAEVAKGRFREDLLYRLADIDVAVPALKDRPEDLAALAQAFAAEYAADHGGEARELADSVYRRLASYDWPGNVRELRSFVRRLLIMAPPTGQVGLDESFAPYLNAKATAAEPGGESGDEVDDGQNVSLKGQEKELIRKTLAANDNNVTRTAEALKIGRATLYRKMKRYGIAS